MTTSDIVAVLRSWSKDFYLTLLSDKDGWHKLHEDADALRRAARRLSRLGDDALALAVARRVDGGWYGPVRETEAAIGAYRRAVTGGQG